MRNTELKPCPFCGGEADISEIEEDFLQLGWKMKGFSVYCKQCRATSEYRENQSEAEAAWNRRAGNE